MAAEDRARLPNDLDIENVIEEIEAAGRSELSAVRSHLARMIEHLAKAVSSPAAYPATKWPGEVTREHGDAARSFTPSMRQNIDLDRVWQDGCATPVRACGHTARRWPPCRTAALPAWKRSSI